MKKPVLSTVGELVVNKTIRGLKYIIPDEYVSCLDFIPEFYDDLTNKIIEIN